MTGDEDSLKVYGGTKLLSPSNNGAGGPRKRQKNGDNELLDGHAAINTDSDSDIERNLRRQDGGGHSSDEGLVSPKKVSCIKNLSLSVIFFARFCLWNLNFVLIFDLEDKIASKTLLLWDATLVWLDCLS